MTAGAPRRAAASGGLETSAFPTERVAKWLLGLRLVAMSALLVGALLVQTTTDEILPIAPLARVAGLTYALSLIWIVLWVLRIPPRLHGALQLAGDLAIVATLVYMTGGPASPFAFLFLIVLAVGALMFGLRGALTVAGAAFALYGALAEGIAFGLYQALPLRPDGPADRPVGARLPDPGHRRRFRRRRAAHLLPRPLAAAGGGPPAGGAGGERPAVRHLGRRPALGGLGGAGRGRRGPRRARQPRGAPDPAPGRPVRRPAPVVAAAVGGCPLAGRARPPRPRLAGPPRGRGRRGRGADRVHRHRAHRRRRHARRARRALPRRHRGARGGETRAPEGAHGGRRRDGGRHRARDPQPARLDLRIGPGAGESPGPRRRTSASSRASSSRSPGACRTSSSRSSVSRARPTRSAPRATSPSSWTRR